MTKTRFSKSLLDSVAVQEKSASLLPVVQAANAVHSESEFIESSAVTTLLKMHPNQTEGVRNLCHNIFLNKRSLEQCSSDIDIYHHVLTDSKLYVNAQHLLGTMVKLICKNPPELVVEKCDGGHQENLWGVKNNNKRSRYSRFKPGIEHSLEWT